MINEKLDRIEKDLECIKTIANTRYFEDLEKRCERVNKINKEYKKEIDRLNNAFDELEKGLEKAINDCKELKILEEYISALDVILKAVKELRSK